jgi:hypothetical protein
MGIAYGTTTLHQATKRTVQDGLVLNLDAGVRDSYDSGTNWTDLKNKDSGSTINSPTFNKANGGSFSFDGSNQAFQMGVRTQSCELQYDDTFTIEAMVYIRENTNTGYILTNRRPSISGLAYNGFGMSQDAGRITCLVGGYDGYYRWRRVNCTEANFNTYCLYKWCHIVWTNDGTQGGGALYLNANDLTSANSDDASGAATITYDGSHRVTVGRSDPDGPGHFLNGSVAIARIYNRALTAAEVSKNFNVMRHRFGI